MIKSWKLFKKLEKTLKSNFSDVDLLPGIFRKYKNTSNAIIARINRI